MTEVGHPDATLEARLQAVERLRSVGVRERLEEARELERLTAPAGGLAFQRARLVVADMLHRLAGSLADGARLAVEVNAWAQAHGERALQARSHLVLSSVFDAIGDLSAALDHAVRAMDLLDDGTPLRERGIHLMKLADACAATGSVERARERYVEAEAAFTAVGDRDLRLIVLNNVTVLEYESGDVPAAVVAAERLRRLCRGEEFNADFADTIGHAYLAAGRHPEALAVLAEGERLLGEQGDSMSSTPGELALTQAQVLLAAGDPAAATERVERALGICAERGLEGIRVRTLAVRAEVLAAAGDFESAYHAHREFYAEAERLRSRQQDAAARTRQALFETEEARREAQRFREQARTDPLTGLPNRRYVDEQLPLLLATAAETGQVLSAAVVDVDHFKQINDRFSHDTGDEVLRRLALLLAGAAGAEAAGAEAAGADPAGADPAGADPAGVDPAGADPAGVDPAGVDPAGTVAGQGFAARLGGEEFVVVRCDPAGATSLAAMERLRAGVEGAPWKELAPGLRVTVSVGLAFAALGDTQRSLLRRADDHLYDAKATGRNRVLTDPA